jgi:hypothetical protein
LGNRPSGVARVEPEEEDEVSTAVKDPLSEPVGELMATMGEGLLMLRDFEEAVTDERFVMTGFLSLAWKRTWDP